MQKDTCLSKKQTRGVSSDRLIWGNQEELGTVAAQTAREMRILGKNPLDEQKKPKKKK